VPPTPSKDGDRPVSAAFYHQAGELGLIGKNVELLEGHLVRKMSRSPNHSWLVIPEDRCVEVHRGPAAVGCREGLQVSGPVRLESTAVTGFSVALADLFPT